MLATVLLLGPALFAGPHNVRATGPRRSDAEAVYAGGSLPFDPDAEADGWRWVRWFEIDEQQAVTFELDETSSWPEGAEARRALLHGALAAWSHTGTARVDVREGPGAVEGISHGRRIVHVYTVPETAACTVAHGLTAWSATARERKTWRGRTYGRLEDVEVFVYKYAPVPGSPSKCDAVPDCEVAAVTTHEIGHGLGLSHLLDPNATMFVTTSADRCRCAGIGDADTRALAALYPVDLPPTITTPYQLPTVFQNVPYNAAFHAVGGSGDFRWRLVLDDVDARPLPPGLVLSADGVLSGTATSTAGAGPCVCGFCDRSLFIEAVDANGDLHRKRFNLSFVLSNCDVSTPTTTVTTTLPPAVTTVPYTCVTTTTTLPPERCDDVPGVSRVVCIAYELVKDLYGTKPRRVLRLADAVHHAAGAAEERFLSGHLAASVRRLGRCHRALARLRAFVDRPEVAARLGAGHVARLRRQFGQLENALRDARSAQGAAELREDDRWAGCVLHRQGAPVRDVHPV